MATTSVAPTLTGGSAIDTVRALARRYTRTGFPELGMLEL